MFKTLKFCFLCFLIHFYAESEAFAQEEFVPQASVGLKGGATFSRINFDPTVKQNINRSYAAGVVAKYRAEPKLGIQVELNYLLNGWAAVPADSNSLTKPENKRLSYLELPLLAHIAFGKKQAGFIINVGPTVSFLLSSRDTIGISNRLGPVAVVKSVPNKFHYGLCVGLGYTQKTPIGSFQLEGRISYGLGNVLRRKFYDTSQN